MSELEHDALQNITPQSERERRLREQLRLAVMSDSEECKLLTTDNERLRAEIERLRAALQEIHDAATHNEILHPPSVAACARRALEPPTGTS